MHIPTPRILILIGLTLLLTACADAVEDVDDTGGVGGAATASLEVFAGNLTGGRGNIDGTGPDARFFYPNGVATDSAGNVYVADTQNQTIRKITSAGLVTTFAGTAGIRGDADGTGAAARFNVPSRIATDNAGNVYVTDTNNHTIRKITSAGAVTTFAGTAGVSGNADGTGTEASFNNPNAIACDAAGNIYVADHANHSIRKITPVGVVTTLAGTGVPGIADGFRTEASFNFPAGVAADSAGDVYVADYGNHTIRKITSERIVTTLAGTAGAIGSTDKTGAAARFSSPISVTTDSVGDVYVADYGNHTIRKISSAGAVTTVAGTVGVRGSADGTGTLASFSAPFAVATGNADNVYVADIANHTIRKITSAGVVTTLAGTAPVSGSADATGTNARFNSPEGVATDSAGNVYVGDAHNHIIRKISSAGVVSTLAGTAGISGNADGPGTAASFTFPYGVTADGAGNVYVADNGNHTIRKITSAGAVTTFAGKAGTPGSADGTGADARFNFPYSVATDSAGNIYVADRSNHTIRKITPVGLVTTLAGMAGTPGSTDDIGTKASFNFPDGLTTDGAGNVYVAERNNHTIRKITSAGVVTTLAGTAGSHGSVDGTGPAARFNQPISVATGNAGNVYVADFNNHTIRKITPAGEVTTVAGVVNQATFTPGALPGRLAFPLGVAVSGSSLYITLHHGLAVVRNPP